MARIVTILLLTAYLSAFGQTPDKLYLIQDHDVYGYIDKTGKTIIAPQFLSAGRFSEGLAPVRKNGTYGYIDTTGKFVIPPTFDVAFPFYKGTASVFIDGKPFLINNKGEVLFRHNYQAINNFADHSFAIVRTKTDKCGVINKKGNLIVDTVFQRISPFKNGVAVVTGLHHSRYNSKDRGKSAIYEMGVIDTLGNWKVTYGQYSDIGEYTNGYAEVTQIKKTEDEEDKDRGIIDTMGNYLFNIPSKKWNFDYSNPGFHQDIAIVDIYAVNPETITVWSSDNDYEYKGAVNNKGEVLFSNTGWEELTPFSLGRAFAKSESGDWFLIDTYGQTVTPQPFERILYDPNRDKPESLFQNGMAVVKTEKGWGAIDTQGKFVVEPTDISGISYDHLIRRGTIIFFQEDISVESEKYAYQYGFWNILTNTFVQPQFHDIDMDGFQDDLIYVMKDELPGYINTKGELVWAAQNNGATKQLNIDYMNRGYYYASSDYRKDLAGLGGWGKSGNFSKSLDREANFPPNKLQIVIDPRQRTTWNDTFNAMKMFVVNTSRHTFYFDAENSRLSLKIQAKDKYGEWKDIEYLPSSWCGNSYHTLFLSPNEMWEFQMPVYEGEFKTRIRAVLLYKKRKDQKNPNILYSNEIEGSVNPGQFWNKPEYHPRGLMDPYND